MPIRQKLFISGDYRKEPGRRISERVIDHHGKEKNNQIFSSPLVYTNVSYLI